MGDPKKQRKKYSPPSHPWQAERIKEEKEILKDYGLKNKKEVWRMSSLLKGFKSQAKQLITRTNEQAAKEEKEFMEKLAKLNLIAPGAKIEDVLDLSTNDIFERRLQTQVVRKGLARTPRQSRQLIVHGHIIVNNKKINVPSYLITAEEEHLISFNPKSALADEEHPERAIKKEKPEAVKKEKTEDEKFIEKISHPKKEKTPKAEAKKEEKPAEEKKPKEEKKEEAPKEEKKAEKKEAPKEAKPKEEAK